MMAISLDRSQGGAQHLYICLLAPSSPFWLKTASSPRPTAFSRPRPPPFFTSCIAFLTQSARGGSRQPSQAARGPSDGIRPLFAPA